jgi:ribosomal peptide maturation radical SAM protein 1
MDEVPDPDYDEFFATIFRLGTPAVLARQSSPVLLIETSRGCWWGQKHHCTFCGLNGNGMTFRAKSPASAIAQMQRLSSRYHITNFEAVDNIIDYRYLEEVCIPLARERCDFRFFYEVKANLKREQLRTMAQAGIQAIQPGIESLNSHILTLMRKGISMLHNVRCIKWAHYYGMHVGWNILTGFPGETVEDYEQQATLLPLLRHLPPPTACGRIWLERFSPYFVEDAFPVSAVRPLESYRFVYPEERIDIAKVAYFFDYEMADTIPDERHDRLRREVEAWKKAWEKPVKPQLVYQRAPEWVQVFDRRGDDVVGHMFHGLAADVFEACGETDRTVPKLCAQLGERRGIEVDGDDVLSALAEFCRLGLFLHEDGRYFTLALPVNRNW